MAGLLGKTKIYKERLKRKGVKYLEKWEVLRRKEEYRSNYDKLKELKKKAESAFKEADEFAASIPQGIPDDRCEILRDLDDKKMYLISEASNFEEECMKKYEITFLPDPEEDLMPNEAMTLFDTQPYIKVDGEFIKKRFAGESPNKMKITVDLSEKREDLEASFSEILSRFGKWSKSVDRSRADEGKIRRRYKVWDYQKRGKTFIEIGKELYPNKPPKAAESLVRKDWWLAHLKILEYKYDAKAGNRRLSITKHDINKHCPTCPKRNSCNEPCLEIEPYINQDHVKERESYGDVETIHKIKMKGKSKRKPTMS